VAAGKIFLRGRKGSRRGRKTEEQRGVESREWRSVFARPRAGTREREEEREREKERESENERESGVGHCFGPLFPKQTASTLFRQEILCSARQAGRTGNGLLSVLLFVINTRPSPVPTAAAAIIPSISHGARPSYGWRRRDVGVSSAKETLLRYDLDDRKTTGAKREGD